MQAAEPEVFGGFDEAQKETATQAHSLLEEATAAATVVDGLDQHGVTATEASGEPLDYGVAATHAEAAAISVYDAAAGTSQVRTPFPEASPPPHAVCAAPRLVHPAQQGMRRFACASSLQHSTWLRVGPSGRRAAIALCVRTPWAIAHPRTYVAGRRARAVNAGG